MKKALLSLVFFLTVLFSYSQETQDNPQNENEVRNKTCVPVIASLQNVIQTVENKGYKIELVVLREISSNDQQQVYLKNKTEYGFMAVCHNKVIDVQLTLYKNKGGAWSRVKRDKDIKNLAVIDYVSFETGQYRLDIEVKKKVKGYLSDYYYFIMYSKDTGKLIAE